MSTSGSDPRHAVAQPVVPSLGLDDSMAEHWQRVSPLAALFFFGRMAKGFVGNLPTTLGSVATLAALARESIWYAVFGGAGLLVLLIVLAVLRFWFFRFCLGEQGVRIRQGIVKRNELDLRFQRIQGVNVEEPLVYRWFGLVTVSFDTAGSSQQEGHLPAVRGQLATTLRQQIDEQRQTASSFDDEASGVRQPEDATANAAQVERSTVLLQLNNADMLRIALTDPTVLILLAALPALMQYMDSASIDFMERSADLAAAELSSLGPLLLALLVASAVLAVLIVFLAVTVASAFLRFHGFRLSLDGNVFRAHAGLLTHKEVVMDSGKIQQLRLSQSWALRCFHRFRLRVLPANSGGGEGNQAGVAQTLHVPVVSNDAALNLRDRMLSGEGEGLSVLPGDERFVAISKHYIGALMRMVGIAPILFGTLVAAPFVAAVALGGLAWFPGENAAARALGIGGVSALIGLAWLLVVALFAWLNWRRWGYMHDEQGLAVRSGFIGFRVEVFLFRKVQGVTTVTSPLQRRRGLATLRVHLASGDVTVPFIEEAAARQLRDYMIYKAESSRLAWH